MPKNQFQRPLRVQHVQHVPRHGNAQPLRKVEAKRIQPVRDTAPLPGLHELLNRNAHS